MSDGVKLPPQNVEAEQSVLGAILLDKNAIVKVADIIIPADFYRNDHAQIYQAMLKLYQKRSPIDLVTLTDELEREKKLKDVGGASYLTSLVNSVPTAAHVAHYAQIIQQKSVLRRLISAASKIAEFGFQEAEDVEKVLDKAESELFSVSQSFLQENFIPIKDVLTESFERIDKLSKNKSMLRGVPTGFADLDNLLAGLQQSDLIILASRPSMGKSSLALNIALNASVKEKVPVGIFSLEMSKEQLVDRLICSQSGLDSWKLRTGNLTDEDFPKIGYAMGVLSEAPIFIDDSPLLNVTEIRTKARRLQLESKIGLIVIDYLQLMAGSQKSSDNRVAEVSEISRALKALARELNVPVLALSQLSRAVEMRPGKRPQLADLRESGCLTGNTQIMHAHTGKLFTIKELAKKKIAIPVLSLREGLKLERQMMVKAFPSGRKKVYKLRLASGKEINASANHPFYTILGWKRLDQLKIGEHLAVPRELSYQGRENLEDEKIIVLAHLIGDGCYLKNHSLQYTNADPLCLQEVKIAAQKAFGVKTRLVKQKNWWHLFTTSPYPLARGRHNPVVKWLSDLEIFNQRSGEKVIPQIIFQLPKEKLALFIKHLWATDGTISYSCNISQSGWTIYYATKSEKLARQLAHLLIRFGITARLRRSYKKGYQPGYHVDISGKEDQWKFLSQIGIFGKKEKLVKKALGFLEKVKFNPNLDVIPKQIWQTINRLRSYWTLTARQFHQQLGWAYSGTQRYHNGISRQRMLHITTAIPDQKLVNLAQSDIFWDEILEIKPLAVEEVYDATVVGSHNFVANDIIVHNSIEQDADVVMFIYREGYYDKDTERKSIADILIRKHRNGPCGDIELFFVPEQLCFRSIDKKRAGKPS